MHIQMIDMGQLISINMVGDILTFMETQNMEYRSVSVLENQQYKIQGPIMVPRLFLLLFLVGLLNKVIGGNL